MGLQVRPRTRCAAFAALVLLSLLHLARAAGLQRESLPGGRRLLGDHGAAKADGRRAISANKANEAKGRSAAGAAEDELSGRDYWERLVGTPSRVALASEKRGVLPQYKYAQQFDVLPFKLWLRNQTLSAVQPHVQPYTAAATAGPSRVAAAPLAHPCAVFVNHEYRFIYVRNRKTASTTFIELLEELLEAVTPGNGTVHQMFSDHLAARGLDPDATWRNFTVLTSSRNPWARAVSGYEYTHGTWRSRDATCTPPSFLEFCRNPYIIGALDNLFNCYGTKRKCLRKADAGGGPGGDAPDGADVDDESCGAWRPHGFFHVEPASNCMVDEAGRLVADFVIRYEHLEDDIAAAIDLINARRPPGLPPIPRPDAIAWRRKGSTARQSGVDSVAAAAVVHAAKYRDCGAECVRTVAEFYAADLELFGWQAPQEPPPAGPKRLR